MPDETDPLDAYEEELKDIEDPSPWRFDSPMNDEQAIAIGRSLGTAILAVMPDIIEQLNAGRHPTVQYFYAVTGCTVEADAVDDHHFHFCIKMPPTGPALYHFTPNEPHDV